MSATTFEAVCHQIMRTMRITADAREPSTAGRRVELLITYNDGSRDQLYTLVAQADGIGLPAIRLSARRTEIVNRATPIGGGTKFWAWIYEIVDAAIGVQLQANVLRETVRRVRDVEGETKWRSA